MEALQQAALSTAASYVLTFWAGVAVTLLVFVFMGDEERKP